MITRETFESRIETIESRMDARLANMASKLDQCIAVFAERDANRAIIDQEREKWLMERDKRIEILAMSAERSAQKAEGLKSTVWLATIAIIVASVGSSVSSFYAIQSSNLALVQATLSIFQQGQNTPAKP